MDQFEIIWILVIVIGALNYDLNDYQKGFRRLLKWGVIFLINPDSVRQNKSPHEEA